MGAGSSSSSPIEERSRSRSCSDSRREQSAFPIEKLRLILFSDEGIKLLFKFISKCMKDGKTINYLATLTTLSYQPIRSNDIYGKFISSFLSNNSASCLFLIQQASATGMNRLCNDHINNPLDITSSLESQLPQLILMLAIGAFPEFLQSQEYELWCQYEQLLITTTEYQNSNFLSSSSSSIMDDGMDYLRNIHCSDFSSLINRPQWIMALAKSFDNLPFPICIHSAKSPHLFLYANECFLTSCEYSREELYRHSIDILLSNPYDPMYQYSNLSYQTQYQHYEEYEEILKEIHLSLKNGIFSKHLLKISTKSLQTVYDMMTFVPMTNLYGEYIYMITVHCNFQTIMIPHLSINESSTPIMVTGSDSPQSQSQSHSSSHYEYKHQNEQKYDHEYKQQQPPQQQHRNHHQHQSRHEQKNSSDDQLDLQIKLKYLQLHDHFIHCLPYRIHHTKYDNYILVNTYLDEFKLPPLCDRNESKISKLGTTEDLIV